MGWVGAREGSGATSSRVDASLVDMSMIDHLLYSKYLITRSVTLRVSTASSDLERRDIPPLPSSAGVVEGR